MTITTPNGLIISAPRSGTGKTTVMLGLLRCLQEDGLNIRPFKCGPDYIDPAFHEAACGHPSANLDSWAMPLGLQGRLIGNDDGFALAEGSMGLFDGVAEKGAAGNGASADIAALTNWPVVLVLDVSGHAQTAAALALGLVSYQPGLAFAGVILNRVASPRHERLCRLGFERIGLPVLGALPRRQDLILPERHLGLVQAQEHPDLEVAIQSYATFLRAHVDLPALKAAARGRARIASNHPITPPAQRIALAQDAAFSFIYPHLLHGWRQAGAEILPFSPLNDEAPPEADLCWLPGGYPELHAPALSGAHHFLDGLRQFATTRPVHGECGGYMVLGKALIDASGQRHNMAGLLGLVTSYQTRKMNLGYRMAKLHSPVAAYAPGTRLRGHEFHYSTILDQPDQPLATVTDADGAIVATTGSVRGSVTGAFFHMIADMAGEGA